MVKKMVEKLFRDMPAFSALAQGDVSVTLAERVDAA
jgi:hypothetical protein